MPRCRGNVTGAPYVTSVITGPPRVHVHLLMHLHVNRAMIRTS